jgi:hypothetical protein
LSNVVHVKGVVQEAGTNKFGYYFLKTNGTTYGFFKTDPKCHTGDVVEFVATQNDKGYWNGKGNVTNHGQPAAPVMTSAPAIPTQRAPSNTLSKDDYWVNREARDLDTQKRIQFQASRNASIAFVDLLLKYDAVQFAAKSTKENKADAIEGLVNHYTMEFNDATTALSCEVEEVKVEGGTEDWP